MPRTVLYTAGVMDETRFEDLRVRLNFPYLLMHQGKCEHLVVFTEVRLAHPSDDQDIRNYPKRLRIDSTLKTPVCGICAVFSAR